MPAFLWLWKMHQDQYSSDTVPPAAGEARAILNLAIPLAVAHIAMVGMEVIDTIVAGQYSAQDLAGLAMGGSIWLILVLFMVGVLGAVLPRMARFYGADDGANVTGEVQQGMILAVTLGLIMTALSWIIPGWLPGLGAGDTETRIAQGYISIIGLGFPAIGVFIVVMNLLESHGLTRFIALTSLLILPLNLLLDYVFVFGVGPFEGMGGVGCAVTSASLYALWTVALCVYAAKHPKLKGYRVYQRWPGVDKQRIKAILGLGLPIGLMLLAEEGYFNISALLIAPLGVSSMGAHQITIQVAALVLMVGLCIGQATAIRASHSIGREDTRGVHQQLKVGLAMVLVFSLVSGALIMIWHDRVPGLFVRDAAVIALSASMLVFAPLFFVFDALQVWCIQVLRGFQDTRMPMLIQLTSYWAIGFPLGYSLGLTDLWGEQYGVFGFWAGFMCGVLLSAMFQARRLYRMVRQQVWLPAH
ncbi:MATE family efflux transporter [Aliamphritea hakodatensis]|uniref:MATE family efflux transporter n=1 Tax=Aliamphritea hakodatensis TaxID=2895352 RepID=UPI0022FDACE9|nr:MATE family efflux transporter [Aliamphritea hakodatensis]